MKKHLFFLLIFLLIDQIAFGQIENFTAGMEKNSGYFTFYWDAKKGKIWLEIDKFDTEFLYYPSLENGVGSNDIGLDRGRLGQEHVVKFQRSGNKILLIEPNYAYRAITNDPLEKRAVEESFATSVQAGFEVAAETEGKVLVDFTPFLMQDIVGAIQAISMAKQGNYKFDASKSAIYLPRTKNFPQNTEFETIVTLIGENAGNYLQQVVPSPSNVTMHQHCSFVQLPVLGEYKTREFDPRIGYGGIEFFDYATAISEPITKRLISRHRLKKKDPNAISSEALKPIVYYMDPGCPEPIRSALMEGASWWNQAYEAAGYKNAFQVKILPSDADPMDIRYNLIQWVHRSTRGWSYGGSIIDPRTGEILKGKVTLGSLRVRQDYLIAQGLIGDFETDSSNVKLMSQMSLDRLKQLAAHEVGHTLGLPHNYIASTEGRASVMDYPHPLVDLKPSGKIDLSNAYAKGIGEYDKVSIAWGYQDFGDGVEEKIALEKIVNASLSRGLQFLTDQDARPEGSIHPQTHLWDNGDDAIKELHRTMEIRRVVLQNFGEKKIPAGTPLANLEEVFVPMYMFHRYQTEATAKVLGGARYTYALRGDKQKALTVVSAGEQLAAFEALMETLKPEFLAVPKKILELIPPRPFRFEPNPRETFKRHTGLSFDPLSPPEAAAGLTLRLILNPERCSRLVSQKVFHNDLPTLQEILNKMVNRLWKNKEMFDNNSYLAQIDRQTASLFLDNLLKLATNKEATNEVRSNAFGAVDEIRNYLKFRNDNNAFAKISLWKIKKMEDNPEITPSTSAFPAPDGQPIDSGYEWLDADCDWH